MDVLSDVLSILRTGRPRSFLHTWQAPWTQHFTPVQAPSGSESWSRVGVF
ncbi:hypothetical protein [Nocardia sp. NPDC058705]